MTQKPAPILYFAYSLDLDRGVMKERAPESRPRVTATLPNFRLVFYGWSRQWRGGTATIRASRGDKVAGGVYEISERDLRRLDALEGYPRDCNRINVTVFSEDDEPLKAITYLKAGHFEETKASPEYLAILQRAYRDWGIV